LIGGIGCPATFFRGKILARQRADAQVGIARHALGDGVDQLLWKFSFLRHVDEERDARRIRRQPRDGALTLGQRSLGVEDDLAVLRAARGRGGRPRRRRRRETRDRRVTLPLVGRSVRRPPFRDCL